MRINPTQFNPKTNQTHLELVDHLGHVLERHLRGHLDGVHLDVEGLLEPPAELHEAERVEPQRRELRGHQHVGRACQVIGGWGAMGV